MTDATQDVQALEEAWALAPEGSHVTLFAMTPGETGGRTVWGSPLDVMGLLRGAGNLLRDHNVYWGVAPRSARPERGRGRNVDCAGLCTLVADLDLAGIYHRERDDAGNLVTPDGKTLWPDVDTALRWLRSLPFPPSVIVNTGGGVQAWWYLADWVPAHERDDSGFEAGELLVRFVNWLRMSAPHSIDSTTDLARVFRAAGTRNLRADALVSIIEADFGRRYELSDLDDVMPAYEPPPPPPEIVPAPVDGEPRPGDDFNARVSARHVLETAGWSYCDEDREGQVYMCREGKDPRDGHSAVIHVDGSVWNYTSGSRLPQGGPYWPFQLLVWMNYAATEATFSDCAKRAAKDLAERGFGMGGARKREAEWQELMTMLARDDRTVAPPVLSPTTMAAMPQEAIDERIEEIAAREHFDLDDTADEPLPTFPLDVLPDWVQARCHDVAEERQVPVDVPAVIALGAISAICATAGMQVARYEGDTPMPLNLYLVSMMRSGAGKSGAFTDAASGVLVEVERLMQDQARDAVLADEVQRKQLERQITDAEKEAGRNGDWRRYQELKAQLAMMGEPVRVPRLLVGDTTPEALARRLAEQQRPLAMIGDEGGPFKMMAGSLYTERGKAPNLDIWLHAYGGERMQVDRVKDGTEFVIERPVLTIAMTVQPAIVEVLRSPVLQHLGLPARFLYSLPEDLIGRRRHEGRGKARSEVTHVYRGHMIDLYRRLSATSHRTITVDADALLLHQRRADRDEPDLCEGGSLAPMLAWHAKLDMATLKTAAMLALLEGSPSVGVESMTAAHRLADYWTAHAARVHAMWEGPTSDEQAEIEQEVSMAKRVLDWAKARKLPSFRARECYRSLKVKADKLAPVLDELVDAGLLTQASTPGPGGRLIAVYTIAGKGVAAGQTAA